MICRPAMFQRLISFLFVGLMTSLAAPPANAQPNAQQRLPHNLTKRVVGDYGYWSKYQNPPYGAAQIPYDKLTHINHAGVSFDAGGTLSVPAGPENEFLEPELNSRAHAAGVKVLLLLGGDFAGIEASGAMQTLVDTVAAFEQQYGYDGVDLDWEYPETAADGVFLVDFMARLRASNPSYVLSVDAAPWNGPGYDLKALQLSIDYVNVMMYDCAGPWTAHGQLNSAIFWDPHNPADYECQPGGSVYNAANIFLQVMPGSQITMGTPFYGYYYTNINQLFGFCPNALNSPDQECDDTVGSASYAQFKPLINKKGWHTLYDPIALVPYMLKDDGGDGFITYDDATSTYLRVYYSDWDRGLGGTFMWALDEDYDGHSQDLLDAMYNASRGSGK